MSTPEERKLGRERARRFRARQAGREYVETRRACSRCGTFLSRYADYDDVYCSACYSISVTLEEHVEATSDPSDKTPGTCKRGHDLEVHGRVFPKGDGTSSRRCNECRRVRAREASRVRYAAIKASE